MNKAILSFTISAAMVLMPIASFAVDSKAPQTQSQTQKANKGPLAPAGAANVKQAQGLDVDTNMLYWAAGGAAIVGVVVWAASDHNDNGNGNGTVTTTPTTTTTGTGG